MSEIPVLAEAGLKPSKRRLLNYPTYVFFVLFMISALNSLDRYVLNGAANVMAKELHLSIADIGYLASAFILFFTFSVIPFGLWSDRDKRKNVIAVAVAIWSVATACTALASSFITLFLARTVLGIGEAGYAPSSAALISDYFARAKRARIMSWWAISGLVGLMMGTIIGGVVAGLYFGAWRLAFVFTGIPGLLLAFIAWRLREPRRNQADEEAAAEQALEPGNPISAPMVISKSTINLTDFWRLLHIKTLLVLIAIQVFTFFVISGTVTYLSLFLQQKDSLGMTSAQAGFYSGIGIVLSGAIGVILGGYISDWMDRYFSGARVLICGLSFLLSGPCYLASVLIALNMHNLGLYSIFFVLTTVLLNINSGPMGAATQDVVPASLRASAVAISLFIGHILGDAFAPSLLGALAKSFDPTGAHFAANMAGHDLGQALLYTYPTSLVLAGLIGILGTRWMKADMAAAQLADREAQA